MESYPHRSPLTFKRGPVSVELSHPVIAAPMAGVIEPPYRMCLHENGVELSYTEMVSARGTYEGSKRTMELAGWVPEKGYSGAQVFGPSSEYLNYAARRMEEIGHHIIDLNAGCPKRKVLAHGAGGAMLKDPEHLLECLSGILDSVKVPVGVKTRSGFSHYDVSSFLTLVKDIEGLGVSYITIHPRTVSQGFRGKADRDVISKVSQYIDIPLIASGDVRTPEDVKDYLGRGASAVMVGRGLLGDPFLISRLSKGLDGPYPASREDISDLFSTARQHLDGSINYFGERRGVVKFRTHLGWYIRRFKERNPFMERIYHINTRDEVLFLMDEIEKVWSVMVRPC